MAAAHRGFVYPRRMFLAHAALLGLLVVTTTGCESCRRRGAPTQEGSAVASASAQPERPLPPLQAPDQVTTLAVRGHADACLLIPTGTTRARPLVAILFPSTNGLRQECEMSGKAISREAFVLCQGARDAASPATPAGAESDLVASALKAALHTVKRKFGQYVASRDLSLVGVGEGAQIVAPIVRQVPDFFHRVALLDAGFRQWTSVDSVRFVGAGGKALLVRCAAEPCRSDAMRVVATVKASGIATRFEPAEAMAGTAGSIGTPADLGPVLAWLVHAESRPVGQPASSARTEPEVLPAPN
jgi:hypothetical protein